MTEQATEYDPNAETVASFTHEGQTYEIDHLGITNDSQWGTFMVYRGENDMFVEFNWDFMELPPTEKLIELARAAVVAELAREAGQ